jgi:hypothetical protein
MKSFIKQFQIILGLAWSVHGLGACVRIRFFAARSSASINGFWVVITPLPLAFVTIRGDACLYIPLFGWAMILAKVVLESVTLISRPFAMVDQGGTEVPRRPAQILTGGSRSTVELS